MSRLKKECQRELGCELMAGEEEAFWIAILNRATPKEAAQRASERLYDALKSRGVKVRD
jgi:hypothetical protein